MVWSEISCPTGQTNKDEFDFNESCVNLLPLSIYRIVSIVLASFILILGLIHTIRYRRTTLQAILSPRKAHLAAICILAVTINGTLFE